MKKGKMRDVKENFSPKADTKMPIVSLSSTSRIAKNTFFLYFRQLLIMLVSLYTSRVVLDVLGVSDYGIYNVISGVVAMFSVMSGAMALAISRFITLEVGRNDREKVQEIFATSMAIQAAISIIVIVLCEGVGYWFLYNRLKIPSDRLDAAFWVMQFSLLTFVANILSVPYNAMIIAHERMSAFAYISVLDAMLRLVAAFLLYALKFDKLIVYAGLVFAVSFTVRFVYSAYCKHHFGEECALSLSFSRTLFSEMWRFIGWAFFGNSVIVIKEQGTNVLLNLFCGTAMNAARGVATQVNGAANLFVSNFMTAMNPQITKSYVEKNFNAMHTLVIRGQKFSFFIMLMLFSILAPNINYVLELWLKEVPPHTSNFVVLILLYSLTETYTNPLLTGVLAEGNIRNYEIGLTIIYTLNIVASYLLLKAERAVEWVFFFNIVFKMCVCGLLLVYSRRKYAFPIRRFLKDCVAPNTFVFAVFVTTVFLFRTYRAERFGRMLWQSVANCAVTGCAILVIGLSGNERHFIFRALKEKLCFIRSKR